MTDKQTTWEERLEELFDGMEHFITPNDEIKLKQFIQEEREKVLREVLPGKVGYIQHMQSKRAYDEGNGWDNCIDEIKNKAKEIGINL